MRTSKRNRWVRALAAALIGFGLSCASSSPEAVFNSGGASSLPEARRVVLLHISDLHAQLEPHPEYFWEGDERISMAGGFARVAAAVAEERSAHPGAVMLLDGGDTIQGSGAATMTEGRAVMGPLSALGIDVGVPGNWEVVYGTDLLETRAEQMPYPLVAANVRDASTGSRVFPAAVVREVGGVRVGVVGYTDPEVPERQPPAFSRGFEYDGPEALQEVVRALREREGADVVVLLSHLGLAKAVELTKELSGVDVHLSGDTHERTYRPVEVNDTWVVEPGAFGSFMGRLELTVRDGRLVDRRWRLVELTEARFDEDEEVRAKVKEALDPLTSRLEEVLGETETTLIRYDVLETNVDNLIADALREATGTDIAISNGFRFGTPILEGPIRERDLWNLLPVVTPLKTGKVTGRQLREFWERELENVFTDDPAERFGGWLPRPSGMTVRFEASAPRGERVREIRIGGAPLDEERTYTLTACEREGEPLNTLCRIDDATDVKVLEIDAHDAVRRYLERNSPVAPSREGRVVGVDLPRELRSQDTHLGLTP